MNVSDLLNELVGLNEIRGELSPKDNEKVEARIKEIKDELGSSEKESSIIK